MHNMQAPALDNFDLGVDGLVDFTPDNLVWMRDVTHVEAT